MENLYEDNKKFWESYSSHLINTTYQGGRVIPSLTKLENLFAKNIKGKLLHPFCNFGMNTIALQKYSDDIVGLDFSNPAIEFAKSYNKNNKSKIKFVYSNFFDYISDEKFDTIFISYGVLDWVIDLNLFFKKVNELLKENGRFIILEYHSDFYNQLVLDSKFKKISDNIYELSEKLPNHLIKSKSILGGSENNLDSITAQIIIHNTSDIIDTVKRERFKIDNLEFYNYLEFKQSPRDIKIGNSKYFKGEYDSAKNMLFGGVFIKI
jgi:SAM-dependent methyltransferase